jgi:hypothetical protein
LTRQDKAEWTSSQASSLGSSTKKVDYRVVVPDPVDPNALTLILNDSST